MKARQLTVYCPTKMDRKLLTILLFCVIELATPLCEFYKPEALRQAEDYCWNTEIELVDRVVKTSKKFLNQARRRLGFGDIEENQEPIKCEYYMCIFNQLGMLNNNGYPVYNDIVNWVENNVIYSQAVTLMRQLDKCNEVLRNCTLLEQPFYSERLLKQIYDLSMVDEENTKQNSCEVAKEFLKCLSMNQECSAFEFVS